MTAALALGPAAPASAGVLKVVAAGGEASGDCTADPCPLGYATGIAVAGDELELAPGEYGGAIDVPAGITLRGAAGAARPLLTGGDVSTTVTLAPNTALRHVEVTAGAAAAIDATGGRIEDVIVRGGTESAGAVLRAGASLLNSVIAMDGASSHAVRVRATAGTPATIRHVTAIATGTNATALDVATISEEAQAIMTNSIMRGDGDDVFVTPIDGSLTSSHSNYRAGNVTGDITSIADQTAAEPLLDATFHQQAGSPTIDAGTDDGFEPPADLDGEGRKLGLAPDIGADERPPPVIVDAVVTPTPTPTPVVETQAPELLIERIVVTENGAGERTMSIRARDPDAPMNGVLVDFGSGMTFGESACSTTAGGVFAKGRTVEFQVPVPAGALGVATVEVRSGGCALPQSERRQVLLTPTATKSAAAPVTAVAAARACRSMTASPRAGGEKAAVAAVLCLMNQVRRAARLKPLRTSRKLAAAARAHNNDMLARHFYAHEQPPGPALAARLKKAKWRGRGAGENIGLGSLALASPKGMLAAWMKSPPHRANILNRRFRFVGIAMQAKDPLAVMRGAAVYTVDFGTSR